MKSYTVWTTLCSFLCLGWSVVGVGGGQPSFNRAAPVCLWQETSGWRFPLGVFRSTKPCRGNLNLPLGKCDHLTRLCVSFWGFFGSSCMNLHRLWLTGELREALGCKLSQSLSEHGDSESGQQHAHTGTRLNSTRTTSVFLQLLVRLTLRPPGSDPGWTATRLYRGSLRRCRENRTPSENEPFLGLNSSQQIVASHYKTPDIDFYWHKALRRNRHTIRSLSNNVSHK